MAKQYKNYDEDFNKTIVNLYESGKSSADLIKRREPMFSSGHNYLYYAKFFSLHQADKNLLAFTDKKVPLYVIQQLYYKLNDIDLNAYMSANDWNPKIHDEKIILEQAKIQMKKEIIDKKPKDK